MSKNGETPGLLKTLWVSDNELLVFLDYMARERGNIDFDILFNLFDKEDMFRFLDLFAGRSIRIPRRKSIVKTVEYIKIYVYLKSRGYDEKSVAEATKIFGKKSNSIIRIYQKVEGVLSQDPLPYVIDKEETE